MNADSTIYAHSNSTDQVNYIGKTSLFFTFVNLFTICFLAYLLYKPPLTYDSLK